MKIRAGDTVVVISGKDKGKSGTVQRVFPQDGHVVVAGINLRIRHVKKTAQEAGRKLTFEAAFPISKVMIIDPKTGKPSRVGFEVKNGKKTRISKKSGAEVVKAKAKVEKKAAKSSKGTEGAKETKVVAEKKTTKTEAAPAGKKQPFWKKMSFGSAAMDANIDEQSNMEKDHTIPSQELHVRKGGRGT
jgi:large subunit ribosomal protein L24